MYSLASSCIANRRTSWNMELVTYCHSLLNRFTQLSCWSVTLIKAPYFYMHSYPSKAVGELPVWVQQSWVVSEWVGGSSLYGCKEWVNDWYVSLRERFRVLPHTTPIGRSTAQGDMYDDYSKRVICIRELGKFEAFCTVVTWAMVYRNTARFVGIAICT